MKKFPAKILKLTGYVALSTAVYCLILSVFFDVYSVKPYLYDDFYLLMLFAIIFYLITRKLIDGRDAKRDLFLAVIPANFLVFFIISSNLCRELPWFFANLIQAKNGDYLSLLIAGWAGFFSATLVGLFTIFVYLMIAFLILKYLRNGENKNYYNMYYNGQ